MNAVRSRKVNYDALQLGNFGVAYTALNSVMERRPVNLQIKRRSLPIQLFSVVSKSSTDSKGEPFVQKFADRFIDSSLSSLQPYLEDLNWMDPMYRAFLGIQ
jgi:hypothetical protein